MSAASVKEYSSRNYDGFFDSPEYANLISAYDSSASDPGVYESEYFGKLQGNIFGNQMDYAFEGFQLRKFGKNPGAASTAGAGGLSTIHIALLAAAAFYFLG